MKIKDLETWNKGLANNQDPYGSRIYSYAKDWAELMETAMDEGKKLEEVAESTSHTADTDGISGFMHFAAVSVLSKVWEYGEQLRLWHNLKTQIRNEGEQANASGGVINPAVMIIGGE